MNGDGTHSCLPGSSGKIREFVDERFAPAQERSASPMMCFPNIDARRKGNVSSLHENSIVFYTPVGCGILIVRVLDNSMDVKGLL
jgi:hypothetical protein